MKISRSWIPGLNTKAKSGFVRSMLVIFSLFYLPSCELFETEVKQYLLEFNSADGSINQVIADGYLMIDGSRTDISTGNLVSLSVSEEVIFLTMEVGGDTYYLKVPSFDKDYDLVDDYLDGAMTFVGVSYRTIGGIGSVSNYSVTASDTYEGEGNFNLAAVGEFQPYSGGQINDLVFQLELDFDTNRTGGVSGGGSGSGGSGSTGGSGSGTCVNEIKAPTLVSYWDQIKPGSATGTGKKVAANTIFSNYTASDVALVIDGTSGSTRYVVQIMLTASNLVANKTLEFRNAGTGTGLTSTGAVGRLIALNGTVNDDWRTNRDFGKNKNMGTLRILTVTPKITGTYSFDASGDGYPSLNNQFAKVSGSFCIDP